MLHSNVVPVNFRTVKLLRIICLVLLSSLLIFWVPGSGRAGVELDLQGATVTIVDSDTIRIRNHQVREVDGEDLGNFSVDYQWTPVRDLFVPKPESVMPMFHAVFTYEGVANITETTVKILTRKTDKEIRLTFEEEKGSLFLCYRQMAIFQDGLEFSLIVAPLSPNADRALLIGENGWSGCEVLGAGSVVKAIISGIPDWFDFSQPYHFRYRLTENEVNAVAKTEEELNAPALAE